VRLIWIAGVVAVAVVVLVASRGDDDEPAPTPPAAERPPDLDEHLAALQRIADDNGGTRAAGSPGDAATADYIEAQLRAAGYRVARQRFDVPFYRESAPPRVTVDGRRVEARALQFSSGGTATGRLRPAGLGCSAGDFAGLRAGEIAVIRRGTCFFRDKALNAQRAGAAAALITAAEPVRGSLQRPGVRIPVAATGELSGGRARVAVRAVSETRETSNVVGEIGPAGRVVMAGAHLDSVPAGPGLNDNGSGVAALLHAAERLAGRGLPLRFGFWGAEEIGLVGSRRYVAGLDAAGRRRIAAYVNLDMVGTPAASPEVYDDAPRIEAALRRHLPRGTEEVRLGGNSDHASFERAGIPVGGIFTGLDDCYHERCDTRRNVDLRVLRTSARAAEAAIADLAG
jgi:Peptidase family M28/PA domain